MTVEKEINHAFARSRSNVGLDADLERELRAAINPAYEDVRGTESFERKRMLGEIDRLRAALRISTNGLRHCANWNIREEKAQALMVVVMENESILETKVANAKVTGSPVLSASPRGLPGWQAKR